MAVEGNKDFLNDFFSLFYDSKEVVTEKYINGDLSKEEYIIKMKAIDERDRK